MLPTFCSHGLKMCIQWYWYLLRCSLFPKVLGVGFYTGIFYTGALGFFFIQVIDGKCTKGLLNFTLYLLYFQITSTQNKDTVLENVSWIDEKIQCEYLEW